MVLFFNISEISTEFLMEKSINAGYFLASRSASTFNCGLIYMEAGLLAI